MKRVESKKKDFSRRDFIRKTSVGIGAAAIVGLKAKSAKSQDIATALKWDKEADIVIVGTGFAGITSAITAHDAGAKVLILEKAPKELEGGNSKVSGNMWWTPTDVDTGIKYITALCYGLTDQESIKTLAQGMYENNEWLKKMGAHPSQRTKANTNAGNKTKINDIPSRGVINRIQGFRLPIGVYLASLTHPKMN